MLLSFNYNGCRIQLFKIFADTLDSVVQMHSHAKNGYEIHYIARGNGVLETENESYEIKKNSLYVTGPNVLHKQLSSNDNPVFEISVYLKILGNTDDTAVHFFASKPFWIGKCSAPLRKIFNQLVSENEKAGLWRESVLSSLTLQMIVEMTRLYYPDNASSLLPPEDYDLNENRSCILDTLLLDDCSDVTLNDFARGMGVSPRQAQRIIKDYYGSSFKKLRYESKMAMAASLLESENITVNECAQRCGYTSLSSFANAFKRKFNMSPNVYKKEMHRHLEKEKHIKL